MVKKVLLTRHSTEGLVSWRRRGYPVINANDYQ
jgi:hypothetical protein